MRSANATQAVTLGQTLFATAPLVNGAVAYAWFVGAAGSETLQAITHHQQRRLSPRRWLPASSPRASSPPTIPATRRSPSTAC